MTAATLLSVFVPAPSVATAQVPGGPDASGSEAEEEPLPAAPPDPDNDPAVRSLGFKISAESRRLATMRRALDQARARLGAAEGRRRAAEDVIVDAAVRVLEAERDLAEWQEVLASVTVRRDTAVGIVAVEEDDIRRQAVTAYKLGRSRGTSMAFAAIREASDPNQFARSLAGVNAVLEHQERLITRARDQLDSAEHTVTLVTASVADAEATVRARRDDVDTAEAEAARLRRAEDDAEREWLAASDRALSVEERLASLTDDLSTATEAAERRVVEHEALVAGAPASTSDVAPAPEPEAEDSESEEAEDDEEEPATLADRRRWLTNRAGALRKAEALPAEHRRLRTDLACPVTAPVFVDDWHYPRSEDRRHEGTDIFGERGSPARALADGVVDSVDRVDAFTGEGKDLGGLTVGIVDDQGMRWYFAHLESIPASLNVGDSVRAGDFVGTVGSSGNAAGTPPHVHLGAYVNGTAVNPYPSLAYACGAWTGAPAFHTPEMLEGSANTETSSSGEAAIVSTSAS